MSIQKADILSSNVLIRGRELTVYFTIAQRGSAEPCRFCGSESLVLMRVVEVTSIVDDKYADIPKTSPLFDETQARLQEERLHRKSCCGDEVCYKKDLHELLGDSLFAQLAMDTEEA